MIKLPIFLNSKFIKNSLLLSAIIFSLESCYPKRYYPEVFESPVTILEANTSNALSSTNFTPYEWPNIDWWKMFDDEQLNALMDKALSNNPDLKMAEAKIRFAYQDARASASNLFPHVGLESDVTRFRISKNGAISGFDFNQDVKNPDTNPLPTAIAFPGFTFTQYEINLNGNYEFDFWRKNLNTFKAAVGEVLAVVADQAFARLLLSVSLAQNYFELQILFDRLDIAKDRVANREAYTNAVFKRFENQIDNELTLRTAKIYKIAAEEQLKEVELAIQIAKHKIYALIAETFDEEIFSIEIIKTQVPQFPLPTDLPLNLLSHRPDVTAAAWRVEEAARMIDVAKVAFYPNFNIAALFGLQTIHPNNWFHWKSIYGQAGPAVNLPIFEGGLLYANVGKSYENYNVAVEQYNKTVVQSVQNVLDSLASLKMAIGQLQDFENIAALSKENLQLTNKRYANQIDSMLNVYDASFDYIEKREQALLSKNVYYQRFTALISALGAGYSDCE